MRRNWYREHLLRIEGGDAMRPDWCDECGARHTPSRRQAILRRLDPATSLAEIRDSFPHFWPPDPAVKNQRGQQNRTLERDLRAIGRGVGGPEYEPLRRLHNLSRVEFRLRRGMA